MDALEFVKERNRMCNVVKGCHECPLYLKGCTFIELIEQDTIDIVEKWSKEHPVKSYLDVFKDAMASVGVTYPDEWILDEFCVVKTLMGEPIPDNCFFPKVDNSCVTCWHQECKLPIKGE